MKIGHCVFEKSDVLSQNWVKGRFSRFLANFAFVAESKVYQRKGNVKLNRLKKFELPISISLSATLVWSLFQSAHWITQGRKFVDPCVIQWKFHRDFLRQSNERWNRMFKFLEFVKLDNTFLLVYFVNMSDAKYVRNFEKRPHAQFWHKTSDFTKSWSPIFVGLSLFCILTSYTSNVS